MLHYVTEFGVFIFFSFLEIFDNMTEDDTMHITLQKRDKGQTWASPILGEGQLDPYSSDLEQKRLMLQRFQEEVNWPFLSNFSCRLCFMHLLLWYSSPFVIKC